LSREHRKKESSQRFLSESCGKSRSEFPSVRGAPAFCYLFLYTNRIILAIVPVINTNIIHEFEYNYTLLMIAKRMMKSMHKKVFNAFRYYLLIFDYYPV
jgi:hypothetical protein